MIYRSPDEAYWLEENPQDAIKIGRTYAYYLLTSYKKGLSKMSIDPAKTKIENSNFQEISSSEIHEQLRKIQLDHLFEKKQVGKYEIVSPLFPEIKDMELVMLEKMGDFIVVTFGYKDGDRIVEIPEKGKMLFSVGVRYYEPIDNRLVPRLIRKMANLPLLRNFTGHIGTTGWWVVFDYNYKYNRNDYFGWVLKEGENLGKKHDKKVDEFVKKLKDKESFEKWRREIKERSDRRLSFLYEWGSIRVERQIGDIEELYKTQRVIEQSSDIETE